MDSMDSMDSMDNSIASKSNNATANTYACTRMAEREFANGSLALDRNNSVTRFGPHMNVWCCNSALLLLSPSLLQTRPPNY